MPIEIREIIVKSTIFGNPEERKIFDESNLELEQFKSQLTNEILEKVERILERNKER